MHVLIQHSVASAPYVLRSKLLGVYLSLSLHRESAPSIVWKECCLISAYWLKKSLHKYFIFQEKINLVFITLLGQWIELVHRPNSDEDISLLWNGWDLFCTNCNIPALYIAGLMPLSPFLCCLADMVIVVRKPKKNRAEGRSSSSSWASLCPNVTQEHEPTP